MKKRKAILLVVLFLICTLSLFATNGNNTNSDTIPDMTDKPNQEATFLIQAYKRSTSDVPGVGETSTDIAPKVEKIVDTLSTVLGNTPQLSESNTNVNYVNMDKVLDKFFSAEGMNIAMITVTGQTGFGTVPKNNANNSSYPLIEGALHKERYSGHTHTITITATPVKVSILDGSGTPTVTEEKASFVFFSQYEGGKSYPIELYFKTSKLVAKDALKRPIVHDKDRNIWFGGTKLAGLDGEKAVPYGEYALTSTTQTIDGSATMKLEFLNKTVRQELANGKRANKLEWKSDQARNIGWTVESELMIKGDRAQFDALPSGKYNILLKIDFIVP